LAGFDGRRIEFGGRDPGLASCAPDFTDRAIDFADRGTGKVSA
jgi:hypothetical protein